LINQPPARQPTRHARKQTLSGLSPQLRDIVKVAQPMVDKQ
jgi:hypothetical protein